MPVQTEIGHSKIKHADPIKPGLYRCFRCHTSTWCSEDNFVHRKKHYFPLRSQVVAHQMVQFYVWKIHRRPVEHIKHAHACFAVYIYVFLLHYYTVVQCDLNVLSLGYILESTMHENAAKVCTISQQINWLYIQATDMFVVEISKALYFFYENARWGPDLQMRHWYRIFYR